MALSLTSNATGGAVIGGAAKTESGLIYPYILSMYIRFFILLYYSV